jgi:hypothetical protein
MLLSKFETKIRLESNYNIIEQCVRLGNSYVGIDCI